MAVKTGRRLWAAGWWPCAMPRAPRVGPTGPKQRGDLATPTSVQKDPLSLLSSQLPRPPE